MQILNKNLLNPVKLWNRVMVNSSYVLRRSKSWGLPTYLIVELTNNCNIDCIMCPRSKQKRKVGYMNFSMFKRVLDQISWAEIIDLDLFGEILLVPGFEKYIKYAKEQGFKISVSTNATLLTEENSKKLINSGLDIIILSFDGTNEENYEQIRKKASYKKTLKNIKRFLKLNNRKIYSVIQMIEMDSISKEISIFKKIWKKSKVDALRIKPYIDLDKSKSYLSSKRETDFNQPCPFLWRWCIITWEGNIVPCCSDYDNLMVLGNIKKESVSKIWNNRKFRQMRKIHAKGQRNNIRLCKDCRSVTINDSVILLSSILDEYSAKKLMPFVEKMIFS